jgi:hypothetical protein
MDQSIWMGISPGKDSTRLVAMRGPSETILKAHLRPSPASTQATARLLEALALWEGRPIRAVLAADERVVMSEFDPSHDLFPPGEVTPLYRLDWVPRACDRFHRDPIRGMGDFRDLKQLLLFEVAR